TAYFEPTTDDVIVDNPDALYDGFWTLATASPDKYGSYYQYATTVNGDPTSIATYVPNLINDGSYNVYIWSAQGTSRTTNAQVIVTSDDGSSLVPVNQTINTGRWRRIATSANFLAGMN